DDNGPEGREWYDKHPNEELEKEAEKGKEFEENGKKLKAKYTILEKLPFLGPGFEINYGQSRQHPDDPLTIALYIKVIYPAGKQIAIDWLKSNGVEPGTIEIIWTS
ncbi:MAG TPA: S-layer protein, partial [Kribbellaceae bacterium]|nr:S-layer protein [Kribbellaceae bacterium]